MAKEQIKFYETEIVAEYYSDKTHTVVDLAKEDIASVVIEPCKVGLFKNKPGKRLIITTCVPAAPIVYYSNKVKDFDSYIEAFEKFCKDTRIVFEKKTG